MSFLSAANLYLHRSCITSCAYRLKTTFFLKLTWFTPERAPWVGLRRLRQLCLGQTAQYIVAEV